MPGKQLAKASRVRVVGQIERHISNQHVVDGVKACLQMVHDLFPALCPRIDRFHVVLLLRRRIVVRTRGPAQNGNRQTDPFD